jgi:hypothetical protein
MLTLNAKLTLLAITLGPIVAVCITLGNAWRQRFKKTRLQIVRMLLATRELSQ